MGRGGGPGGGAPGGGFSGGSGGGGGFSGGPGMGAPGGSRGGYSGGHGGGPGPGMGGPGPGMGGHGGGPGPGMGGPGGGPRPGMGGPGPGMGGPGMGGRPPRRRGGMGMGCLGTIMFPVLIVIIVVIMIIGSFVTYRSGGSGYGSSYNYADYGYSYAYEDDGISRTKLESNLCIESPEWIDDELGWIRSKSTVEDAMQDFYSKTGVQPYLILTDNIDGKGADLTNSEAQEYMVDVYNSLYEDQGHMILAFVEYAPAEYNRYIYVGDAAESVIDSSAREFMLDLVDRYYWSDLSDDELFETVFMVSADTLMENYISNHRVRNIIIIILVIGAVLIVILVLARRVATARARKAEATKKILDTPIGESPENEDLLKKYGSDSDKDKS